MGIRTNTATIGATIASGYTQFNTAGTMRFYGSAKTWNDIPTVPFIVADQGQLASEQPARVAMATTFSALAYGELDYSFGSYEISHDHSTGTNLDVHLHWSPQGVEAGDTVFVVRFDALLLPINVTSPNGVTSSLGITSTLYTRTTTITISANTPSPSHWYTDVGDIPSAMIQDLGTIINWRLTRIASAGTDPNANPYFFAIGIHIEQDSLGSAGELTKYTE